MIVKDEHKPSDINVYNDYCCPMCGNDVRFIGTSNQGVGQYYCDDCRIVWISRAVDKK